MIRHFRREPLGGRSGGIAVAVVTAVLLGLGACAAPPRADLEAIYGDAARHIGDERMPVIVIPGILGSKLQQEGTGLLAWGAFNGKFPDASKPEGARIAALPMQEGVPLSQLRDDLVATEVLDKLSIDIGPLRGLEVSAYLDILTTLAAGKYRDSTLARNAPVNYGGKHYTCYQFAYDWRRDISEHAAALHRQILEARAAHPRHGKVDVVAHSMGGLLVRYYLMYGPTPLPEDGSLPEPTWEGAKHVSTVILIGTPNSGSVQAIEQLVKGIRFLPIFAGPYPAGVLGTMPAIYQLMPRGRHERLRSEETGEALDPLALETWVANGWGLASENSDETLRALLPGVESRERRREIAIEHLGKSLARARQFFEAIERPVELPEGGPEMFLVAGDGRPTADVAFVRAKSGRVRLGSYVAGDGVVTRTSALGDERAGAGYSPRLRSRVHWAGVQFLPASHLDLTRAHEFSDFVLYALLERPRDTTVPPPLGMRMAPGEDATTRAATRTTRSVTRPAAGTGLRQK